MRVVSNVLSALREFSVGAAKPNPALSCIVFVLVFLFTSDVSAETRLYHLRVTLRNGERYETISSYDPINYCCTHGGSVVYYRDYSLIFSPEMKVKVLRTWIETGENLRERFDDVLEAHGMLTPANYKSLPPASPLAWRDMRKPE